MAKKKRLRQQLTANRETVNKDVKTVSGGLATPIKPVNILPPGPLKKSENNVQSCTSAASGTSRMEYMNTYDDVLKVPHSTQPETPSSVSHGKPPSIEVIDEDIETPQQTQVVLGKRLKDPKLISRIIEYLENRTNKKAISFCAMTDYLQSKYLEYRRKKRAAFKIYVEKAYSMWASENLESENSTSESDTDICDPSVGDGPDVLKEYKDTNAMNSMMSNMYKSSPSHSGANNPDDRGTKQPAVKQVENTTNQNIPDPRTARNQPIRSKEILTETQIADETFDKVKSLSKTPKKVRKSTKPDEKEMEAGKNSKKDIELQKSTVTFADVGGNDKSLTEICKLLVHMRHPEVYQQLGVTPPRGFLLHGPPGCGKTLLANAIAGELDLPILKLAATEIVSGVSGDSEAKIRDLFEKAQQNAPCIMFIDEIDSITPKRETASKDMERRIVAQLLACMDDLNANPSCHVLVIGATNRADSLDPALRRAGRFDREISLGIPDEQARLKILQVLCRGLRLEAGFDFQCLAHTTPGYVGADLMALTREAAITAVNRVFQALRAQPQTGSDVLTPVSSASNTTLPSVTHSAKTTHTLYTSSVVEAGTDDTRQAVREGKIDSVDEGLERKNCLDLRNYGVPKESINAQRTDNTYFGVQSFEGMDARDASKVSMEQSTGALSDTGACVAGSAANNLHDFPKEGVKIQELSKVLDITSESYSIVAAVDKTSSAGNTLSTPKESELQSVLSWLKEHPPLTESQLRDLYITMTDFQEALKCVQPSAKREGFATVPDVTWDDIGALQDVREELQLAILAPVRHPEQFQSLGLTRAQGVLLAGPPGCGKTLLAKAVANESGINFISVKGPELLNMYVGESERAVRTVFQRARNSAPCVIFFDELDALCPKRSGHSEGNSSARVVNQLLTEMDGLEERRQVYIMAATNRPDIIDPAVLRPGRLDKTLYVGLPCLEDRLDILNCITKNGTRPQLGSDVCLSEIAADQRCNCYTGADLAALVREASIVALKAAILRQMTQPSETIIVRKEHFQAAFRKVKPSVSAKDHERYLSMRTNLQADGDPVT
ncbi:nuclear valosin-containing protein-like isoform X2 [Dreissena polymorpha]|uniref:nuclear valosin-containing protein-like isoform X2 n=1 Tax=Dreissena polymorpha TaxID=45954 RepID=UPI002264E80B|nr:nuclear valosin-containing protein-like isoform X2 [Dreissena polymorpha]